MSRQLWAFDFRKAVGTDGKEVVPDANDLTEGLFVLPKAFPAKIVPREIERVKTIKAEWSKMESLLDSTLQWKTLPEGMIWRKYEQTGSI